MVIRPQVAADREWIISTLEERWGSSVIVAKDRECDAANIEALIANGASGERIGLLTYRISDDGLEVVTLDSIRPGTGIGTALLARATEIAQGVAVPRLWLITTNDNLGAIGFYESRGLRIVAVHKGAVDRARLLKASIPVVSDGGIELHDEIELELDLVPSATR
jgi:ribosomal protein S18 acetylase RimI-like enzyme